MHIIKAEQPTQVGLCGVDKLDARAALEEAGCKLVIEAGLGAGPDEYVAARVNSFPASVTSRSKWGGVEPEHARGEGLAYENLLQIGAVDACGMVQLSTRTVGAPFVRLVAACLVIAELVCRLHGGPEIDVVDLSLKTPNQRTYSAVGPRVCTTALRCIADLTHFAAKWNQFAPYKRGKNRDRTAVRLQPDCRRFSC